MKQKKKHRLPQNQRWYAKWLGIDAAQTLRRCVMPHLHPISPLQRRFRTAAPRSALRTRMRRICTTYAAPPDFAAICDVVADLLSKKALSSADAIQNRARLSGTLYSNVRYKRRKHSGWMLAQARARCWPRLLSARGAMLSSLLHCAESITHSGSSI
jgi:hypothetical protein